VSKRIELIAKWLLLVCWILPVSVFGQSKTGGTGASMIGVCGPPAYCARADLSVQQESPLPFPIGPQGYTNFPYNTVFIDPDFGERILRVTDNTTLTGASCFNLSAPNNSQLSDGGNSDDNGFSSDSKWLRVADSNGNFWLFSFNPATMQVGCVKATGTAEGQLPFGNAQFGRSLADAGIYFGVPGGGSWAPEVQTYNVSTGGYATIVDFRTCSGLSWLSSLSHGSLSWNTTPNLSLNDDVISESMGPTQNEGWITMVYQQSTGKCGWLDTRTGQIGGNLWPGVTQVAGAFPLNFGVNGGPSVPTAVATTGGSLITGHQYAIQYSLVYETTANGKGESAGSTVQYVTLGGSNTAISLPSPAASANDSVPWSHYNIYACDNTASPGCTPTLQPAGNLGCSMGKPTLGVSVNTTGSTTYTYIEEADGPTCNTWDTETISNGAAAPNNTLTPGAVSGAYFYRVIKGAWSAGTATVDQGVYPGQLSYAGSTGGASVTDTGQTILLSAVGTMSCNASYTWMPTPGPPYNCNNNATLMAISAGGPAAPTTSTLGIFLHEITLSFDGSQVLLSTEALSGSPVLWKIGTSTAVWCNMNSGFENPPNSYAPCGGHVSMAYNGLLDVYSARVHDDPGQNFSVTWRPWAAISSNVTGTCASGAITVTCETVTTFPAVDPNGTDNYDSHPSWNNTRAGSEPYTPYLVSTDAADSNPFMTPTYIGRAWAREVYAVNPLTGIGYRFAHHRATSVAYNYGGTCSVLPHCESAFGHASIAQNSDDGKWAVFNSDMDWLLGCKPNTTCTYNSAGQVISGESRVDVFIVELK